MTVSMTIKSRLLLTIGVVVILSSLGMGVYSYQNQVTQLLHRHRNLASQQHRLFTAILSADAEGLRRAVSGLSRLEALRHPLATRDRNALLAVSLPIFEELKSKQAITHMYLIAPDGTVLLRAHLPEQHGDRLTRATYLQAAATKQISSGLEMGKNFFSLRCVAPLFAGNQLLGYLEVAEEIDHIFARMREITGNDVALFLPRDYLLRFDSAVKAPAGSAYAVLYPSTSELALPAGPDPDQFLDEGLKAFTVRDSARGDTRYLVSAGPIQDAFGETAAVLFSQQDITSAYAAIWRGVMSSLTVFAGILAVGNLLLYFSMRKSLDFFLAIRRHIQNVTRTWDLDKRIEIVTDDEIGELAEDLNRMQTEIGSLKSSLIHRAEELAAANQELESFSYTLSHDLRVPLTRAYAAAQLLEESCQERLDDAERSLLENICKGCEGMEDLIEAILVLTNIVRRELLPESLDLADLAREIVDELRAANPERQIEVAIPDHLRCTGDRQLMRVALRNLLENAWKYTRAVPHPRIELGDTEQQHGKPVFYVKDNGVGFNMQQAAKLFTPFKRLHDAKQYPGTGIGLATVEKIILRHGGSIRGVGKEGEGATFFFTLPG